VTYLHLSFLIMLLAPLVMATWRVTLLGLAGQGFILSWMMVERGWHPSAAVAVQLLDVMVVRTLVLPRLFYVVLRNRNTPPRNDVIPPNLLSWAMSGILVVLSFRFANRFVPDDAKGATELAVAAAAVLLGFMILASGNNPLSQMVGVLRIENGIFLFELSSEHGLPWPVQLGVSGVYLATVLVFAWFLARLPSSTTAHGVPS
jgi:hydrogenase-4 component E